MEQDYKKNIKNFIILMLIFAAFSVTIYLDKQGVKTISEATYLLSAQQAKDIEHKRQRELLEQKRAKVIQKRRAMYGDTDNSFVRTQNSNHKVNFPPLAWYNQYLHYVIWERYKEIKDELVASEPTIIFLVINEDGKLINREIIGSSGNKKNDKLALSLFPKNITYHTLPEGISKLNVTYTVGKHRFSSQSRIISNNTRG